MIAEAVGGLVDEFVVPNSVPHDWNLDALQEALRRDFNLDLRSGPGSNPSRRSSRPRCARGCSRRRSAAYEQKVARTGAAIMRHVERDVVLRMLDQHWRDHLAAMDYLRQGIHLRGYAQKDYRFEYKREAFELFSAMLGRVKFEAVSMLSKVEVRTQEQLDREEAERRERLMRALQAQHAEAQSLLGMPEPEAAPAAVPGLGAAPLMPGLSRPQPKPSGGTVRALRSQGRTQ